MRRSIPLVFGALAWTLAARPAAAQWPASPDSMPYLAHTEADEQSPIECSDGDRGWFVAWSVTYWVSGTRVQRLNRFGEPQWGPDGAFLPNVNPLAITATGDGDVLLALRALGSQAVLAQRLDRSGAPRWPQGPIHVADSVSFDASFVRATPTQWWLLGLVRSDPGGRLVGIPIVDGAPPDPSASVAVLPWASNVTKVRSAATPSGDVLISRNDELAPAFVRVQRLRPDGSLPWGSAGVVLSVAPYNAWNADITSDGAEGAFVGYRKDYEYGSPLIAAVQRLRSDGSPAWSPAERTEPSDPHANHGFQALIPGPAGSTRMVWRDQERYVAFARIDTAGVWYPPPQGIYVAGSLINAGSGLLVAGSGEGGFVALWDNIDSTYRKVLDAQAIGADDTRRWGGSGRRIFRLGDEMWVALAPDPAFVAGPRGDVMLVWQVKTDVTLNHDVIFTHADENGALGVTLPRITGLADVPQDHGGVVRVNWAASALDHPGGSVHSYALAVEDDSGNGLTEVVQVPASGLDAYVADCPGVRDSLGGFALRSKVRVVAHVDGGRPLWSPPDSAWAIDDQGTVASPAPRADRFGLVAVAPSPARGSVRIDWALPRAAAVRLTLLDAAGRHVTTLVDRWVAAGPHEERLDLRGADGRPFAPGLYFLSLTAGDQRASRRLVISR